MLSRDAYIAEMKQQLDELNASMHALEAKAKEVKQDIREAYTTELKNLEHQSKTTGEKFDELKASGEESWKNLVQETEKLRDAFVHSFKYFKTQI